ncbi:MAG: hypothetical protein LLG97_17205 [Deltaproteobacteria bacterium]|nr:hypothetical protein [Deltaproteobacteria bacterium]
MKTLCLAVILFLSAVSTAEGAEMTVAVIKGHSALPHEEVLAGFAEEAQSRNANVRFVSLEDEKVRRALDAGSGPGLPDIILCLGAHALEKGARFRNIPKIFSLVTTASLEPWAERSDIYGVSLDVAPATQFRILRQALPGVKRIGVLYDPSHNQAVIEEAKKAAAASGFNLLALPVSSLKDLPSALGQLERSGDLLWSLYDPTVYSPESAKYLLMQSLQREIPVVGFSPHFAKAGALLALYGDYRDMGRQAAIQALAAQSRGEGVIRWVNPRVVKIAVNEKVRRFLGVTFPAVFRKMVNQSF